MEAKALSFVLRAASSEHYKSSTRRVFTYVVGGRVGMNDTCYFTLDMKKLDPTPPCPMSCAASAMCAKHKQENVVGAHRRGGGPTKNMAACFSSFSFPLAAAKASDDLLIPPGVLMCVISKILEQKLWPFNVKGADMSEHFVKHQRTDDLPKSVC